MTLQLAALGGLAGILTTLAGQGGGLFLLLAIAALASPHDALAITAPALLIGNLHRALLFRRAIAWTVAARVIAGAIPGAFVGGLVAGAMPAWALRCTLVMLTFLSIARAMKWLHFGVPLRSLAPAGFVIGAMTGTAGGAGILFAPVMLSVGLRSAAYIGTTSAVALATHTGRVIAYTSNGLFSRDLLVPTIAVAVAITAGNSIGERVRKHLSDRVSVRLEYGVLVVCVLISLFSAL